MPRHDPAVIRRAMRIARLAGAVGGLLAGLFYGLYIIPNSSGTLSSRVSVAAAALLATGAMGLIFGFLVGPALSVQPYLWLEEAIDSAAPSHLLGATLGLIVALVVGVLVTVLLSGIPDGIGYLISLPFTCVLVYICVTAGMRRRADFARLAHLFHSGAFVADDRLG